MNRLSKRQQAIVSLCEKHKTSIDVGCDHGYVGAELLKLEKTEFLIATDISEKSLLKAQKLFQKEKFKNAKTVCANGLDFENSFAEQIIIAGMGGKNITDILENYKHKDKILRLILQPMKEVALLRKYLNKNNFFIEKDIVICDKKKFYHIFSVRQGKQNLKSINIHFGVCLSPQSEDFYLWLNEKEQKIKKITQKMPKDNEKLKTFQKCLDEIEKIKQNKKTNSVE